MKIKIKAFDKGEVIEQETLPEDFFLDEVEDDEIEAVEDYDSVDVNTLDKLDTRELSELYHYNMAMYRNIRLLTKRDGSKPARVSGPEMQEMEFLKCKYDIQYFLKNYCVVTAAGAPIRLLLNDKLILVAKLYEASVPHLFMTSRQSAKTTIELCCIAWYFNFWSNTGSMLINLTQADNKKNMKFIKDIITVLPDYLKVWNPARNRSDVDNTQELASPDTANSKVSGIVINKTDPNTTGRGKTGSPYWDEIAYLKGIEDAFAAVMFTYNTYSDFARDACVPAPMSVTTTPNDTGSEEGAFFHSMWNSAIEMTKLDDLQDLLPHEIYQLYKNTDTSYIKVFQRWYEFPNRVGNKWLVDESNPKNIRHILDNVDLTVAEVRQYDDRAADWLDRTYKNAKGNKRTIKKDVFCLFFNSSESAIFDEEVADQLTANRTFPKKVIDVRFNGDTLNKVAKLNFYKNEFEYDYVRSRIIISVDPAESAHGDNLAINLLNEENMEVVADLYTKTGKIRAISDIILEIHKLFPNSPVIIERNNFGKAVIERIEENKEMKSLFRKLFYYYEHDKNGKPKTDRKIYGIYTTKDNRDTMFTLLMEKVQGSVELLNSPQLISELLNLEYKKGKIQAGNGGTDDSVMSYAIALYVKETKYRYINRLFLDNSLISCNLRKLEVANDMKNITMSELEKRLSVANMKEDIEAGDKLLGEFRDVLSPPSNPIAAFIKFNM